VKHSGNVEVRVRPPAKAEVKTYEEAGK